MQLPINKDMHVMVCINSTVLIGNHLYTHPRGFFLSSFWAPQTSRALGLPPIAQPIAQTGIGAANRLKFGATL